MKTEIVYNDELNAFNVQFITAAVEKKLIIYDPYKFKDVTELEELEDFEEDEIDIYDFDAHFVHLKASSELHAGGAKWYIEAQTVNPPSAPFMKYEVTRPQQNGPIVELMKIRTYINPEEVCMLGIGVADIRIQRGGQYGHGAFNLDSQNGLIIHYSNNAIELFHNPH